MDISNIELGKQNSISIKNKNSKQFVNKNVNEDKFTGFLNASKSRHDSKSTPKTNLDKVEVKNETKSLQDNERNDSVSMDYKCKDSKTSLEKIDKEEFSSEESENLSENNDVTEKTLQDILKLLGIDMGNLIETLKKSSNPTKEIQDMLKSVNLDEQSSKLTEAQNKLNMLIQLMDKASKASIPNNLISDIPSRIKNELMDSNYASNSTVVEELSNDSISNNSKETDMRNKLIESILSKLKGARTEDLSNNSKISGHELFDKNNTHNNLFEEMPSKIGVEDEKTLKENISSKESDLLKKLAEVNKSDSKVDRVTSFMNILSSNSLDSSKVEVNNKVPVYISKSTFNEDIIKAVKFMDLNGIKDLSVKIYPKELGEVFISVTMEHGALKASIKATSKDAVEMLNLGLRDINEKINFDNSKIQSVDIGLYNEDTTYFSNGNLNQNQQHESEQFMRKNSRNQDMLVEEEVIMEPIMHESAVNLLV